MKKSIRERLKVKTFEEINAIAKRINVSLYGNKSARIKQLDDIFDSIQTLKIIKKMASK